MGDQFVENDLRDNVINQLLKVPENNVSQDISKFKKKQETFS